MHQPEIVQMLSNYNAGKPRSALDFEICSLMCLVSFKYYSH